MLPNALSPIITLIGLSVGHLLGGTAIIEILFFWQGIGDMVVQTIFARDYSLIQGYVICNEATRALLESVFSVHDDPEGEIKILPGEPPSPVNMLEGCPFAGRCKYASDLCRRQMPEWKALDENHRVACHLEPGELV